MCLSGNWAVKLRMENAGSPQVHLMGGSSTSTPLRCCLFLVSVLFFLLIFPLLLFSSCGFYCVASCRETSPQLLPKVSLAIRLSNHESSQFKFFLSLSSKGCVCVFVCICVKGPCCSFSYRLLKFPQRIKAVVSFYTSDFFFSSQLIL